MTYNDLKIQVSALGFENDVENSEALLCATRRALMTIYTERPVYSTLEFYHTPTPVAKEIKEIRHKGGEVYTVKADAKAYCFKTLGVGTFTVKDAQEIRNVDFSAGINLHKGFLGPNAEIEFSGDYSYNIYDFCLFDDVFGADEESIPERGGYKEYKISELTNDFLAFSFIPIGNNDKKISGATLLGDIAKIPNEYSGRISLIYKTAPKELHGNADDVLILPSGCEHLLALLVAAYVWLDDDADKAQYYMNLYRDGMSAINIYSRISLDASYEDVTGWA